MTQPDWPGSVTTAVISQVRRIRRANKMSAEHLANRTAALGMHISRCTLANLESGRREMLTVPELLILAKALEVGPAHLLLSPDRDGKVELFPGEHWTAEEAIAWFTAMPPCGTCGDKPHPGFTCNTCGRSGS